MESDRNRRETVCGWGLTVPYAPSPPGPHIFCRRHRYRRNSSLHIALLPGYFPRPKRLCGPGISCPNTCAHCRFVLDSPPGLGSRFESHLPLRWGCGMGRRTGAGHFRPGGGLGVGRAIAHGRPPGTTVAGGGQNGCFKAGEGNPNAFFCCCFCVF